MTKIYPRPEVEKATLEYFGGDELATNIFVTKYAKRTKEGEYLESVPLHMHERLAHEFARMETKFGGTRALSFGEILHYLDHFQYVVPQGSPMQGIGNDEVVTSLSNCLVVQSPEDTISSIMDAGKKLANLFKRRCGVGLDISNLRSEGLPVNNAAGTTTGAWSFADYFSYVCRMIGQCGRRGALMITIDVRHPDIFKFVRMKQDMKKVTGANVSVRLSDEFMYAVMEDQEFTLQFPCDVPLDQAIHTQVIRAKDLWDEIINSATKTAEPGLLMWDNILRDLPAEEYFDLGFKTICTNPSLRQDTKVATRRGVFPIKELADRGEEVVVRNLLGEWRSARVFMSGRDKTLYKITFTNGQEVFCTPEHKWPIFNTSGNIINPQTGKVKKKETKDLVRRDKIYFPTFSAPIDNEMSPFTEDDGFVLGWNLGDGWICHHSAHDTLQYGFIFSEGDRSSGISDRVLGYTNNIAKRESTLRQENETKSWSFVTTDSGVLAKFQEMKSCRKDQGIPESVWQGNAQFIHGFVDGLFSSDGCVMPQPTLKDCRVVLTTKHPKLASDVQKLLSFYGVRSNIRTQDIDNASFPNGKNYGKTYTRYDLVIFGMDARKFASTFKLSSVPKQEKLDQMFDASIGPKYVQDRDYLIVKSVEETNIVEDVYDITVNDETHTFQMECGITGNCSEIPLSVDSCRLISVCLKYLVKNPFTSEAYFDYEEFQRVVSVAMRMSDDLVELEFEKIHSIITVADTDDEKEMWEEYLKYGELGRRVGLGTHGLADCLARMGIAYDSEEALSVVDKIYEMFKVSAYGESVELAKERGAFPLFDWEREKNNAYIQRLPKSLKDKIRRYGRRNIAILTNAPTGSVSYESQSSQGIEPVFRNSYTRRRRLNHDEAHIEADFVDDMGDRWQNYEIFHNNAKEYLELTGESELPDYFVESDRIDWDKRVELQSVIQRHIDHAISSTINLPRGTGPEVVANIYLQGWKKGLKGITVYVDGCRDGVLLTGDEDHVTIEYHDSPVRPEILDCDIHHPTIKGEKWVVLVGLLDGKPYEVMGGLHDEVSIPLRANHGKILKRSYKTVNRYDLHLPNGNVIKNIMDEFNNPDYGIHTRMISMALRHGVKPNFVVEQLRKDPDSNLTSFSKVVARTLSKHYVEDGTRVASEKTCPDCQEESLVYIEGCVTCSSCGYAKCG